MFYDSLKKRVNAAVRVSNARTAAREDIQQCIAPCYLPLHEDIGESSHSIYHLPGGRGSCKSSFVSLEIVDGIMEDSDANAIVFRRIAGTMRESVFSQIAWAIEKLGVSSLWRGSVSPMQFTYIPTGQQIVFRGLDDPLKIKSIKPRHGAFKFVWFEEFAELTGENMVRNVLQSVVRGGNDFKIFNSFNPPLSVNNWANRYILLPDDRATIFRSDYTMIPPEWLGESFLLEAERLKELNERSYRHEYLGEAIGSGGEVFPNVETREINDKEILELQYVYCGLDFGFSVDPFAFVRLSYDRKTRTIYFLDEIVKRGCGNADIADLIKEKGYDKASPAPFWDEYDMASLESKQLIIADAAEPKSIADLQKLGLKVTGCTKFHGSVLYGIRWLQSKRIVIDPKRTPISYQEFTQYEYSTTKDGEFLADVPDKDNHCIDACRYALDRLINSSKHAA